MQWTPDLEFINDSAWEFLSKGLMELIEWVGKKCERHSRDQSIRTQCVIVCKREEIKKDLKLWGPRRFW